MNSPSATTVPRSLPAGIPASARTALTLLQRLQQGSLTLRLPDGTLHHFGPGGGPTAALTLRNWNVFGAALRSGDIGFAESYIAGDWTTPQLTDLLKLLIANRHAMQDMVYGHWAGRLLYRLRHLLHRNTRSGSQKNIHAHYDLGNGFYRLWLDESMNYSSAWFEGDQGGDLTHAQDAKVRRALRQACVQPGQRVLEIGCGWGALAEMAATEFGASVTGVTLSSEQLAFAVRACSAWASPQPRTPPRAPRLRTTCACRTTATSTTAPTTPSAPLKWSKRWAASTGPPISRPFTGCCAPEGGRASRAS